MPWALRVNQQQLHVCFSEAPAVLAQGRYDRVHVGACCPRDRLHALTALLRPSGGIIVSPVAPSDLQAISVSPNGEILSRTLSQVRYSDLEVGAGPVHATGSSWHCFTCYMFCWSRLVLVGGHMIRITHEISDDLAGTAISPSIIT